MHPKDYQFDSSHEKYIKITVSGILTKEEIIATMTELMQHPEYSYKHSLWAFSKFSMGLSIENLKEIADIVRDYKPKGINPALKSAIVVPGKVYKEIAVLFIKAATEQPFNYQAFTDKDAAISFLCS